MIIDALKGGSIKGGAPRMGGPRSNGGAAVRIGMAVLGSTMAPPPFIGTWPNGTLGRGKKKKS